jgi:hypothetical protein
VIALRAARIDAFAAVCAGIAAAIGATAVQVVLWAALTDALPAILFRDSRFAAAIVLGREALSPPATFDGRIILIATLVHFALAVTYGLILALLIARLRTASSLVAGCAFGLCLYVVNMYGFTTFFPWFASSRDWITATAHAAFGLIAAGVYHAAALREGRRQC